MGRIHDESPFECMFCSKVACAIAAPYPPHCAHRLIMSALTPAPGRSPLAMWDRTVHSVNVTRDEQAACGSLCEPEGGPKLPSFRSVMPSVKGSLASGFVRPQSASEMVRPLRSRTREPTALDIRRR